LQAYCLRRKISSSRRSSSTYREGRLGLKYRRVDGRKKALLLGDLYTPFATALELSSKLRLKALDLLHLAYVKALIEQGGKYAKSLRWTRILRERRRL
jgi:hypothetical protein